MDNLFFLISKIAWGLLSPSNLIIFLLLLAGLFLIFNRIKAAKLIMLPTVLFAFVIMVYPIQDYLLQPLEKRFSQPKTLPGGIDGIIVLGGGEDFKRSVSWQTAEMGRGGDRFVGAARLAGMYPRIPIIYTGGSGSLMAQNSESSMLIAKTLLTNMGVSQRRLIIESQARNTYENFEYTKPLLPNTKGTYILVTSAFHMPRAVGIARKLDVNVIPYPVDYYSNSDEMRAIAFDFNGHMSGLEIAYKEWIGLTVYYLTDKTSNWFPSPEDSVIKTAENPKESS